MKAKLIAALVSPCLLPFCANASNIPEHFSLEPVYSIHGIQQPSSDSETRFYHAVGLRLGYQVDDHFSVAIGAKTGVVGDDTANGDRFSLQHGYGFYFRSDYPLSDDFGIYGMLGYEYNDIEIEFATPSPDAPRSSVSYDDSGPMYEVGGVWWVNSRLSVSLGYGQRTGDATLSSENDLRNNFSLTARFFF